MATLPMTGMKDYKFTMTVSAYDCTGCGSCANVCPGKKGAKALAMENMEANAGLQKFFDYGRELPIKEELPQIEEHPVAFAMYILSPNSCVVSLAKVFHHNLHMLRRTQAEAV